jgi:hypothetical protein
MRISSPGVCCSTVLYDKDQTLLIIPMKSPSQLIVAIADNKNNVILLE